MKVVCFHGLEGHGKSHYAKILEKYEGFKHLSFAYTIKKMAGVFTNGNIDYFKLDQKQKLEKINGFDFSPRDLLRVIGCSFRDQLDQDIWVKYVIHEISKNSYDKVVIDDLRFDNEARLLKEKYGKNSVVCTEIVNIERFELDRLKQTHITNKRISDNLIDFTVNHWGNESDHDIIKELSKIGVI